jgi:hypothetical protein
VAAEAVSRKKRLPLYNVSCFAASQTCRILFSSVTHSPCQCEAVTTSETDWYERNFSVRERTSTHEEV